MEIVGRVSQVISRVNNSKSELWVGCSAIFAIATGERAELDLSCSVPIHRSMLIHSFENQLKRKINQKIYEENKYGFKKRY